MRQSAPELLREYQTTATRQSLFEQRWAQSFPALTASEVTLSDPEALKQAATRARRAFSPLITPLFVPG